MLITLFKSMLLYLNCFNIARKTIQYNNQAPLSIHLSHIVFSLLLSVVTLLCKDYFQIGTYIIPLVLYHIILTLMSPASPIKLLGYSVLSYSLSFILFSASTIIISLATFPLCHIKSEIFINLLTILASCITIAFTNLLFKNPRTRNLFHAINSYPALGFVILFSLVLISIFTSAQLSNDRTAPFKKVLMIGSIIIIFLYDIFLRSQITKSYREKLRLLEVESLRASQQEQANYIAQLEKENERMGRIIHKDNRIVNAMADSVAEYLKDTTLSDAKRHEKGVALSEQIEAIRTDRQNILLSKERIQPNPIAQTGYVGVDALIAYIAKEAAQYHIALQFDFREDFFEGDTPCMPEEDLVHLLSDTLKNAIIATKHNNGKIIKLSMLKLKGIPSVAIADSGIPFTVNTYMNFGLEKSSTHTDEGGSGIGLLDIWSLKEKYKASLYIDEALNSDIFTKQIVFIFDKKNRYMISSNRYKEIQRQQSRADLYVVNPATEGSL